MNIFFLWITKGYLKEVWTCELWRALYISILYEFLNKTFLNMRWNGRRSKSQDSLPPKLLAFVHKNKSETLVWVSYHTSLCPFIHLRSKSSVYLTRNTPWNYIIYNYIIDNNIPLSQGLCYQAPKRMSHVYVWVFDYGKRVLVGQSQDERNKNHKVKSIS